MMLAEAVNVTDMSVCEGKYKGCDALAENIIEVAKSINENCATLYFNEKEYYKCEAEIAEPVCKQVDRDFKDMCGPDGFGYAGQTGYSVEHGYFGSESPANIHGAFCNGCAQIERAGGCFASSSVVDVRGRGSVTLDLVQVGDMVRSVDVRSMKAVWTRVLFTHTHEDKASTVTVRHDGASAALRLTLTHPVLLESGTLRRARDLKVFVCVFVCVCVCVSECVCINNDEIVLIMMMIVIIIRIIVTTTIITMIIVVICDV